ncbi:MAG: c-type cytochrome domain-containing protein [Planctomycetota bacterium]
MRFPGICQQLLLGVAVVLAAAPVTAEDTPAAAGDDKKIDFVKDVEPIFAARCNKCHGERRSLGGFSMHNAETLTELIDSEYYIWAGNSEESEVYARLILDPDDELRMPKGGQPLDAEQIKIIKLWIDQGAELTSAAATGEAEMDIEPKAAEEPKAEPKKEVLPAPPAVLDALRASGASIVPMYTGSPLLSIGFPSNPRSVDDATIDRLLEIADNIVWLDVSGSQITDAGAAKLAQMQNLERLHLEKTAVTDAVAAPLSSLGKLQYLNLYATAVTDSALTKLAAAPKLEKLFLWKTDVSYAAVKQAMADRSGLEINLGWDHPGVVRDRLSGELAAVLERKKAAELKAAEAEQALAEAKGTLESAASREAELKAALDKLDQPKPEEPKPEEPPAAAESAEAGSSETPAADTASESQPAEGEPADPAPAEDASAA